MSIAISRQPSSAGHSSSQPQAHAPSTKPSAKPATSSGVNAGTNVIMGWVHNSMGGGGVNNTHVKKIDAHLGAGPGPADSGPAPSILPMKY